MISVVWDDYETEYPEEYIRKCIETFERFEVPAEVRDRRKERRGLLEGIQAVNKEIPTSLG